jgi:hypothetical protein
MVVILPTSPYNQSWDNNGTMEFSFLIVGNVLEFWWRQIDVMGIGSTWYVISHNSQCGRLSMGAISFGTVCHQ